MSSRDENQLRKWVHGNSKWAKRAARARGLHLGRLPVGKLIVNYWVAWGLGIVLVLSVTLLLAKIMPLIMLLFVGPVVGTILVANVLDLDDALPDFLHTPHLDS